MMFHFGKKIYIDFGHTFHSKTYLKIISLFNSRYTCAAIEKKSGEIFVTKCTCPQSTGGKCTHVACLLYFIDEYSTNDEGPKTYESCTSLPQKWGQGSKVKHNPKPIGKKQLPNKL